MDHDEFIQAIQDLGLDQVEAYTFIEMPEMPELITPSVNWSVEYAMAPEISFSWNFLLDNDNDPDIPNWMRYDPKEGF